MVKGNKILCFKQFFLKAVALRGGAPPGLCVKRSSQESSEAESKVRDYIFLKKIGMKFI